MTFRTGAFSREINVDGNVDPYCFNIDQAVYFDLTSDRPDKAVSLDDNSTGGTGPAT